MIKFGLFGAGRIGSIHGNNTRLHRDAELVALHDPVEKNSARLAAELGCEQWTAERIFASDAIDAVLICSATDTHAGLIEQAVDSGKHVFCEKPIDLSLPRVRQCCQRVAASDIRAMVAFNRRFDPNFRRLREQLDAGAVGELEMLGIVSRDPAPPPIEYVRVSGGLFRDMMIHDFDMARYLLGEEIIAVSAQASCLVDPAIGEAGDVDTAVVTLTTTSGKLAQISNSRRASYGYDQRIEIHGSAGMLEARNVNENTVVSHTRDGVTGAKPMYFFLERYAAAYRRELDEFIRSLQGEPVDLPGMEDGLQAMLLAEAALQSLAQGRCVKPGGDD